MAAYGQDKDTGGLATDLDAAIRELQWVEFASGTNRMRIPTLDTLSAQR